MEEARTAEVVASTSVVAVPIPEAGSTVLLHTQWAVTLSPGTGLRDTVSQGTPSPDIQDALSLIMRVTLLQDMVGRVTFLQDMVRQVPDIQDALSLGMRDMRSPDMVRQVTPLPDIQDALSRGMRDMRSPDTVRQLNALQVMVQVAALKVMDLPVAGLPVVARSDGWPTVTASPALAMGRWEIPIWRPGQTAAAAIWPRSQSRGPYSVRPQSDGAQPICSPELSRAA